MSVSGCRRPDGFPTPAEPIREGPILEFSLSHIPKTDETAELTFSIALNFYTQFNEINRSEARVQAWIEFTYANIYGSYQEAKYAVQVPLEEVLVSGELSWEGNPFDYQDSVLPLVGTIHLPREGIWEIKAYLKGEGFDNHYMLETFKDSTRIAVTKDAAAVIGSIENDLGPLFYLSKFPYGKPYRPIPDELLRPVIVELDISRAPLVNEEAVLNCYVTSLYNVSDFDINITFRIRQDGNKTDKVSGEHILINGDLSWSGKLSKDFPTQFSSTIKFPWKGDWWIHVQGNYPTSEHAGFADDIRIHVTSDLSYFTGSKW